jgi:sugar lactone lactonase YvrE
LDSSGVVGSGPAGAGGQIVADAGGGFDVQLSYTYAETLGNPTFSVSIRDAGGASTSASTSILSVADAPLAAGALTPPAGDPAVSTFVGGGLNAPDGLARDAAGNLYIANAGSNTVTKVTPAGAVSTFVSSGLDGPAGLAFDAAGNLYVANFQSSSISKVTRAGAVSTFVSSGLDGPIGLAFDAAGNLYVADFISNTISKVTRAGAVSAFVSNGLIAPTGLAFDGAGNLYVGSYGDDTISKVTPAGGVSTFATSGLDFPAALAFAAGNLYVASAAGNTISEVTSAGAVSSFVSSGLDTPVGLAFDAAGNLYVANAGSGTVSKITPPPPVVEGQAFSGTVFHFTDANSLATAGDYTAVVTLGDGNRVTLESSGVVGSGPAGAGGQIVADADGGFDVQLSYTYAEAFRNHIFSVQVSDAGGASTGEGTGTFSVGDAPLTAGALTPPDASSADSGPNGPCAFGEGQAFSGTVFRFTDANPLAAAGDYTAVVNLGDGKSVTLSSSGVVGKGPAGAGGQIVADAGGGFDVQLSYAYAKAFSNQLFSVQVADVGGASIQAAMPLCVVGPVSLSKSTIAVSPSKVAPGGASTVTLTARDANGNQELGGGLNVIFKVGGSAGGTVGGVTDNLDGTYTATFTAGTKTGSATLTATIGGKAVTSKPPAVTVTAIVAGSAAVHDAAMMALLTPPAASGPAPKKTVPLECGHLLPLWICRGAAFS